MEGLEAPSPWIVFKSNLSLGSIVCGRVKEVPPLQLENCCHLVSRKGVSIQSPCPQSVS